MKIKSTDKIWGMMVLDYTKIYVDGELYVVVAYDHGELIATKLSDIITDGKVPLYVIHNVLKDDCNYWEVKLLTNGTAIGFVEVEK